MQNRSLVVIRPLVIVLAFVLGAQAAAPDPLPSWNAGPVKQSIVSFVAAAVEKDGAGYIAPDDRIAVFDNDGTLWSEQPIYFQVAFALDRVKELAPQHPEWKTTQPFKAVLEGDMAALQEAGEKGLGELMMATHTGMTTDEFAVTATNWLASARHPACNCPYTDRVYVPMLELLSFLRAHGFKTYIVSGGTVEFMRAFAEPVYGVPSGQVIGSTFATQFRIGADGKPESCGSPGSISSTTGRASPSPSTSSSAGARSSPSATPMATSRCWSGPLREAARVFPGSCTIPTPRANTPTTGRRRSDISIKRSTKPTRRAGPWST